MILELIQKTYRIIRNWWDTINRGKVIITKTKEFTAKSWSLIKEVRQDGIHFDDLNKIKEWWGDLWNEAENIATEVGALGEKLQEETKKVV